MLPLVGKACPPAEYAHAPKEIGVLSQPRDQPVQMIRHEDVRSHFRTVLG